MRRGALLCLALLASACGAQTLEDWLEAAPDPEALALWLDDLRAHPLDLNRASVEAIAALPLLDASTAQRLIEARTHHGSFHSLSQVLSVDGLTAGQREALRAFAVVRPLRRGRVAEVAANLWTGARSKEWQRAKAWRIRGRADFRRADGPRGFVFVDRGAGDPRWAETVSAGIELEPRGLSSRLLLGEFQQECGTGLVFAAASGMANWLSTRERQGPGEAKGLQLKPAASGRAALRGAALEVKRAQTTLTLVGSRRPLDGAAGAKGIERVTEGESGGVAELTAARKDQIDERLLGFCAQSSIHGVTAGVAGCEARYSPDVKGADAAVLPQFKGNRASAGSVFLRAHRGTVRLLGEVAAADPGGQAMQAALDVRPGSCGLTLYHTQADADYFWPRATLWGGFGEAASNASVWGVRWHADGRWQSLWVGASASRTPFRTATVPLCRTASELDVLWRLNFWTALGFDVLLGRQRREDYTTTTGAREVTLDRARLDVSGGDVYRVRYEVRSAARTDRNRAALGTLLSLQGRGRWRSLEIWGRLTFFHFADDDVATAQAEYSPVGGSALTALTSTGHRAALALSREWRGAGLALKLAQSRRDGSGETREDLEIALQLSYRRY